MDFDRLLAGCGLPRIEARALLEHASGRSREWLIAHGDEEVPAEIAARFRAMAGRRREGGEPLAYLVGRREFHGRDFDVGPGVLIPRPETELLVDLALAAALSPPSTCARRGADGQPEADAPRVLELGTGSGCVAITLACLRPGWTLLATDRSRDALEIARSNAERLCAPALASGRLQLREGDWWSAVRPGERFALIVSNPPYIADCDPHLRQGDLRFEPQAALAAGGDGLDALRVICAGAAAHLEPGGTLMVEHGFEQGGAVRALFESGGLADLRTVRDAAGLERVTVGRIPLMTKGMLAERTRSLV